MFARRTRLRLVTFSHRRAYSAPTNPYANFEKLRAYPFAFDEVAAKRALAPIASAIVQDNILQSILSYVFPSLDFHHVQPKRIVPVYFPAWIIDAELRAKVRFRGRETVASALLQNGYLPGSDYTVLSTVPLFPIELQDINPLPWSDGLLNQQGQQIACLPYTIDPTNGLKAFTDHRFESFPDLYCSVSSVEPTLAVARPVLLPLYLAHYESEGPKGEKRAFTAFLDASQDLGTRYGTRIDTGYRDDWDNSIDRTIRDALNLHVTPSSPVFAVGPLNNWVDIESVSLVPHRDISKALSDWISWKMHDPETASKLAAHSKVTVVNDSDPMVREYDTEDREQVEAWMGVSAELMLVRRILGRIDKQLSGAESPGDAHMAAPIQHLRAREQELREKRTEILPEWAKEQCPQAIEADNVESE